MTNVQISPLGLALTSLAWLSLVRSAAVYKSVNWLSIFAELCSLKTAMSCSIAFMSLFASVMHNVSVHWHITSLMGSEGCGIEVG